MVYAIYATMFLNLIFVANPFMQLCTLEFETRRASYYWLLDALGLYQPYVWEYSRLNVTNTVMSKRKVCCSTWESSQYLLNCMFFPLLYELILSGMLLQLNRLVTEKWVDGWDDPRLMTLAGLRRRGVTSTSINAFVRGIGITRRLSFLHCIPCSVFCTFASTFYTDCTYFL